MDLDSDLLERIVPEEIDRTDATARQSLDLHLERYGFAARQSRPGRLLDAACGVGYGTELLFNSAAGVEEAIGVDISQKTIDYAREHYARERVSYRCVDLFQFEDDTGFDTIVSLETIEHVEDPVRLVSHLVSLLKPSGRLVASVPTTPSVDLNPHHRTDFTEGSFRELLGRAGLREVDSLVQIQPVDPLEVLLRRGLRARGTRPDLGLYYLTHPRALAGRLWSTVRHGFENRYLVLVGELASRADEGTVA